MTELLDLVARWVHVIAGILWVGNSMLFNWLDRNLVKRPEPDSYGDIWLLHSGGFYILEKNTGVRRPGTPHAAPPTLHWFKWQAYTTWISGAVLLVVVYYLGGRALLVDPSVYNMQHGTATVLALGLILVGWGLYELLWRTLGTQLPRFSVGLSLVLLVGGVVVFTTFFSGRAAFLHVGAMLGTIMAANVAMTIVPSQRELVAALAAKREPSQELADRAKARSIHNNYITFPVIALMVSSHFPSLYATGGKPVLLTLLAAGGAVRYAMNHRFDNPRWVWQLGAVVAISIAILANAIHIRPGKQRDLADFALIAVPASVTFDDARRIIDRRCTACHSSSPSEVSLGVMPAGITFDSVSTIKALVPRIWERAIVTRTMPPGNKTMMTDAERAILFRWIENGAPIK